VVQEIYKDAYPEVLNENILTELVKEEEKFRFSLEKGLRELNKLTLNQKDLWDETDSAGNIIKGENWLDGKKIFYIFSTFGFPLEMSLEEINRNRQQLNNEDNKIELKILSDEEVDKLKDEFDEKLKKHQDLSRTASAGMFKGGLADNKEETTALHTTAHLMLAGLRKVLGEHVHQKGSNINGERLRFDFSHPQKMTDEEKKDVEDFVNQAIDAKVPVEMNEMSLDEAKANGAEGAFENKYGEVVKVYKISGYSNEICGGPHVVNTGDIKGKFRIAKEESSSAGVRRIKATIG
jgi:alanyl-tRNA synthetase